MFHYQFDSVISDPESHLNRIKPVLAMCGLFPRQCVSVRWNLRFLNGSATSINRSPTAVRWFSHFYNSHLLRKRFSKTCLIYVRVEGTFDTLFAICNFHNKQKIFSIAYLFLFFLLLIQEKWWIKQNENIFIISHTVFHETALPLTHNPWSCDWFSPESDLIIQISQYYACIF